MNQDPARHPACTIIFDRPTGLQIARYIDVEPGTRRILRCSPEGLETAQPYRRAQCGGWCPPGARDEEGPMPAAEVMDRPKLLWID